MAKYTLVYFNGRGRAEVSRMLFALADVEFVDTRIEGEEWAKLKPETPFAQLPILKFDDVTLCQSDVCEFYLAKTFGLAGSNDLEEARILMIGGCTLDTVKPLIKLQTAEVEIQGELRKKYETEQLPKFLGMLEKLLVSNKGGDGYFVGDKISLGDLKVLVTYSAFVVFGFNCNIDDYPKLKSHKERVENEPRIAAWIAKRPDSTF